MRICDRWIQEGKTDRRGRSNPPQCTTSREDSFFKKRSVISRRKQKSAFDQVSEFDRGRIVAYRDCGLSFREIGSRVGRN
ncbi:hypothetical protein TNCV_795491 [Trichonephila clavipes]|nr:hypothetical protein TNCV_795491 [Trichonephila clavipes]